MADNQLQTILTEQNVAKDNAQLLLKAFGAPFEEAGIILSKYKTIKVTDQSQTDLMADAREKRLALKKIRTTVENKRKELKEDSLRTGRAIDSVAKFVKEAIEPAEQYLEAQEKFAENLAKERKARITAERREKLTQYDADSSMYKFEDMSEDSFESLIEVLKDRQEARLTAEKQAEADRIKKAEEEVKEQERIRKENEELKKQAELKEKAVAAERKEQEIKLEAERAKANAAQEEADRLAREITEHEATEAKIRADAEATALKVKQEAEEQERQALLAPDKEKLLLVATIIASQFELGTPDVKSKKAQEVLNYTETILNDLVAYIKQKAEEL